MNREEKIYFCTPEEVTVEPGRIRKEFKKKPMEELVESILDKGQLQPGICIHKDGKIVLVAGERRLRACEIAKVPYAYTLKEETNPLRIREIEYEENIVRADLTWQEQTKALEDFHKFQQELYGESVKGAIGGHSIRDTAAVLHRSVGNLAEDLELAAFMELEEVADAPNKTEAKKIVKRLKDEYERSELLRRARKDAPEIEQMTFETEEGEIPFNANEVELAKRVAFFSDHIVCGDMEDVLKESTESYDVVLFDPPWGVNYNENRLTTGSQREFEDDEGFFKSMLPRYLQAIFEKMAQDSHLYMFFGIVHYDFIYSTLEAVGFKTNGIPIIWYKQGMHRTRTPDLWPGRSYEPIAFARKGDKALVRKGAPDLVITPFATPAIKQSHSAAKHPDVYIDLLKRSALPGDKILDPMCGSGMAGVACEVLRSTHQLKWKLIEKEESFADLALANVVRGYSQLVKPPIATVANPIGVDTDFPFYFCPKCNSIGESKELLVHKKSKKFCVCPKCNEVVFMRKDPPPTDYRKIDLSKDLGRAEWKACWQLYPEQHEEMLQWKANQK